MTGVEDGKSIFVVVRLIHVLVELAMSRPLPGIVHENDFDRGSCPERSLGPSYDESITSHNLFLKSPIEQSDNPWAWLACLIRMYI